MNTKVNGQSILIVLLLSILIFVSTGTHVQGQIGGDTPVASEDESSTQGVIEGTGIVPGGPGFIMISPFDFRPRPNDNTWAYSDGSLYNLGANAISMETGLTLPHGATISKVTLYYKDNSAEELRLILARGNGSGETEKMLDLKTLDAMTAFRYASLPVSVTPVIDNQNYSYYLYVSLAGNVNMDILLSNVRIDYGYTVYTPSVMKN